MFKLTYLYYIFTFALVTLSIGFGIPEGNMRVCTNGTRIQTHAGVVFQLSGLNVYAKCLGKSFLVGLACVFILTFLVVTLIGIVLMFVVVTRIIKDSCFEAKEKEYEDVEAK